MLFKRLYGQIFEEPENEVPEESPPPSVIMWLLWLRKLKAKTENFTSFQGVFSLFCTWKQCYAIHGGAALPSPRTQ